MSEAFEKLGIIAPLLTGLQKAGIAVQDVIVSINGTKIKDSNELRKYLYTELEVGDKAQLEVYRGNEKVSVQLALISNSR